ncbi:MAG: nitroreductase family protein [Lachnospiraceae bacterium]|nr:nitroreductase family protein [Lachnospiraceae bacterium]
MEFSELVKIRRSFRKYKDEEVLEQDIVEMVKTALQSPSWANSETARYYVALSKEAREEVLTKGLPEFNRTRTENAGAFVITTFVKGRSGFMGDKGPANELGDEWGAYDMGLSNAYFLLRASELGYGSLIMGLRDADALRKTFNIPENEEISAVIAVGKPDEEAKLQKRKEVSEVLVVK